MEKCWENGNDVGVLVPLACFHWGVPINNTNALPQNFSIKNQEDCCWLTCYQICYNVMFPGWDLLDSDQLEHEVKIERTREFQLKLWKRLMICDILKSLWGESEPISQIALDWAIGFHAECCVYQISDSCTTTNKHGYRLLRIPACLIVLAIFQFLRILTCL